jgi:hypothetical protein
VIPISVALNPAERPLPVDEAVMALFTALDGYLLEMDLVAHYDPDEFNAAAGEELWKKILEWASVVNNNDESHPEYELRNAAREYLRVTNTTERTISVSRHSTKQGEFCVQAIVFMGQYVYSYSSSDPRIDSTIKINFQYDLDDNPFAIVEALAAGILGGNNNIELAAPTYSWSSIITEKQRDATAEAQRRLGLIVGNLNWIDSTVIDSITYNVGVTGVESADGGVFNMRVTQPDITIFAGGPVSVVYSDALIAGEVKRVIENGITLPFDVYTDDFTLLTLARERWRPFLAGLPGDFRAVTNVVINQDAFFGTLWGYVVVNGNRMVSVEPLAPKTRVLAPVPEPTLENPTTAVTAAVAALLPRTLEIARLNLDEEYAQDIRLDATAALQPFITEIKNWGGSAHINEFLDGISGAIIYSDKSYSMVISHTSSRIHLSTTIANIQIVTSPTTILAEALKEFNDGILIDFGAYLSVWEKAAAATEKAKEMLAAATEDGDIDFTGIVPTVVPRFNNPPANTIFAGTYGVYVTLGDLRSPAGTATQTVGVRMDVTQINPTIIVQEVTDAILNAKLDIEFNQYVYKNPNNITEGPASDEDRAYWAQARAWELLRIIQDLAGTDGNIYDRIDIKVSADDKSDTEYTLLVTHAPVGGTSVPHGEGPVVVFISNNSLAAEARRVIGAGGPIAIDFVAYRSIGEVIAAANPIAQARLTNDPNKEHFTEIIATLAHPTNGINEFFLDLDVRSLPNPGGRGGATTIVSINRYEGPKGLLNAAAVAITRSPLLIDPFQLDDDDKAEAGNGRATTIMNEIRYVFDAIMGNPEITSWPARNNTNSWYRGVTTDIVATANGYSLTVIGAGESAGVLSDVRDVIVRNSPRAVLNAAIAAIEEEAIDIPLTSGGTGPISLALTDVINNVILPEALGSLTPKGDNVKVEASVRFINGGYRATVYVFDATNNEELEVGAVVVELGEGALPDPDDFWEGDGGVVTIDGDEYLVAPFEAKDAKTVADLLAEIADGFDVEVVYANGDLVPEGTRVGTGMIINILDADGEVARSITIIIMGDTTGNGQSNVGDAIRILDHVGPGAFRLEGAQFLAAKFVSAPGANLNVGDAVALLDRM